MNKTTQSETIIDKLEAHIVAECSVADTDRLYDDMLDECSSCCDMCKQYGAARILKELDPTAYRCGKNDYIDGCDITEVRGEEYHDGDLDKAKEEFLDALREELSELKTELEEILDDDADEVDIKDEARIQQAIHAKQAEIDEVEAHSF